MVNNTQSVPPGTRLGATPAATAFTTTVTTAVTITVTATTATTTMLLEPLSSPVMVPEEGAAASSTTVAMTDYERAFREVQNFDGEQPPTQAEANDKHDKDEATKTTTMSNENKKNDGADLDESPRCTMRERVKSSFESNLRRILEPLPDDEYYETFVKEEYEELQPIDPNDDVVDGDDGNDTDRENRKARTESQPIPHPPRVEYDEEELLDREALSRAKQLREEVRVASAEVSTVRAAVVERATSMSQRETSLLLGGLAMTAGRDSKEQFDLKGLWQRIKDEQNRLDVDEGENRLGDNRRETLERLVTALELLDRDLPATHGRLSRMLQTVHRGTDGVKSLSQTETAIRTRSSTDFDHGAVNAENASLPPDMAIASVFNW